MLSLLLFRCNAKEDFSDSRGQRNQAVPLQEGIKFVYPRPASLIYFHNLKT